MLSQIKTSATKSLRRAGFISAGAILVSVGAAFLTVAAWLTLSSTFDALMAATVIGSVYFGAGLLVIGLNLRADDEPVELHKPDHVPVEKTPPMLQAFLYGLQAGSGAGHR